MFYCDYNAILGAHEQKGSKLPSSISCDEFNSWTNHNNLTHLLTRGAQLTWSNRRGSAYTTKRLDRAICNHAWTNFWSGVSYCTLTKSKSDHFPLLLVLQKEVNSHSSSFKFMRMWASHPTCHQFISQVCNDTVVVGCPMVRLASKLKSLKLRLRDWNKQVFDNVHD